MHKSCDPSIYTTDHSKLIVFNQKEEQISHKELKNRFAHTTNADPDPVVALTYISAHKETSIKDKHISNNNYM